MGARSKGCITCKSRRVKCDETSPSCKRCQKAGITCKGYEALIIIDEKPRIERARATSNSQQKQHYALQKSQQKMFHSGSSRDLNVSPFSTTTLPLTAFKKNVWISFLVQKMYEGRTQYQTQSIVSRVMAQGWWVGEMIKTESSKSLEALAAMFFGKAHNLQHINTEGLKLYSEALLNLRSMLGNPESVYKFQTLASMTTLCMYELVAFRAGQGWNFHARGLGGLIELRGPWRHKSFPEKSVFLEHRLILLSRAIVSRQTSFLSQKIWKDVPWEDDPSAKEPIDFLLDILCDVTGLIHDADHLSSNGEEMVQLGERVAAAFEELNGWWREWIASNPRCCEETNVSPATTMMADKDGLLFKTRLVYGSFWAAYTVNIHNAIRIQLLGLWDMVTKNVTYQDPSLIFEEPNTSPLLGITRDSQGLAREIFRSLEYCHIQSRHHLGTFCLLFPLDFAYSVLGMESREARWLWENDKDELANIGGFKTGTSVMSLLPTYHFDVSRKKSYAATMMNDNCELLNLALEAGRQEATRLVPN